MFYLILAAGGVFSLLYVAATRPVAFVLSAAQVFFFLTAAFLGLLSYSVHGHGPWATYGVFAGVAWVATCLLKTRVRVAR